MAETTSQPFCPIPTSTVTFFLEREEHGPVHRSPK